MVPFTRILGLAAAGALIAFTAVGTPARADESSPSAGSAPPQASVFADCKLLRRAISRRACQARLWREEHVDTAENK
jgi:hypothetical protein